MLQISESSRKSLLSGILNAVPGIRGLVHSSRVRKLVSSFLHRYPLKRKLPGSEIVYEVHDMENFYTAEEIFQRESYRSAFRIPVSTFIDLGANCGYFSCYVAHRAAPRSVRGLLVEANEGLLPQIRHHLKINNLSEARLIHGLVGKENDAGLTGELVLSEAHTSSSQSGLHPHAKWKGFGRRVSVPFIDVLTVWRSFFGGERVDLLKIDIEGSEEAFVFEEPSILPLCNKVVIECHKWSVDRDRIFRHLQFFGLIHKETLDVDENFEVALFERDAGI